MKKIKNRCRKIKRKHIKKKLLIMLHKGLKSKGESILLSQGRGLL
jgi:hypothetical protein